MLARSHPGNHGQPGTLIQPTPKILYPSSLSICAQDRRAKRLSDHTQRTEALQRLWSRPEPPHVPGAGVAVAFRVRTPGREENRSATSCHRRHAVGRGSDHTSDSTVIHYVVLVREVGMSECKWDQIAPFPLNSVPEPVLVFQKPSIGMPQTVLQADPSLPPEAGDTIDVKKLARGSIRPG
jgi:hypothetical protein